jgi:hypothetical protein
MENKTDVKGKIYSRIVERCGKSRKGTKRAILEPGSGQFCRIPEFYLLVKRSDPIPFSDRLYLSLKKSSLTNSDENPLSFYQVMHCLLVIN